MNVGNGLSLELGKYQKQVNIRIKGMQDQHFVKRLWNKEEGLWLKDYPESEVEAASMGWLNAAEQMMYDLPLVEDFCKSVKEAGFEHAVLLGMGGSSLTPMVFKRTFESLPTNKRSAEGLKLTVLDSTDPETVRAVENDIDLKKTLFIVSSKSGSTAEVMAFYHYFYNQVQNLKGEHAGENFIAITDEGSPLSEIAKNKKFRKVFLNFSDIGGRYSALSYFGIVPAALMGIDVKELLKRALTMSDACGPHVLSSQNPGVILGATIAQLALQGCDKLTYVLPPSLSSFGLWLEQLLAESTGKNGTGILPLNGLPLMKRDTYSKDRLFFELRVSEKEEKIRAGVLKEFVSAEHPVLSIQIDDELDLGREFFRWEIASATAGAILGVNPFDQPNVQESKKCTDRLLKIIEENGALPEMNPTLIEKSLQFYYKNEKTGVEKGQESAGAMMADFLKQARPGDYISLQAYLTEEPEVIEQIQKLQRSLQKNLHIAVTTEFGPRYLHSTGQYNKGGPNTGMFIQFINNSASSDIQIPNQAYTFGSLKKAQAIGDMEALLQNKRRVILIDLGENAVSGLSEFQGLIDKMQQEQPKKELKETLYEVPLFVLDQKDYSQRGERQGL